MPYRTAAKGGGPGQTRIGNLGRLLRSHHRVKTHGHGWVHRQPVPGVHYWRTPTGYWVRVDATGTHRVGTTLPADLADGPAPAASALEERFAEIIAAA